MRFLLLAVTLLYSANASAYILMLKWYPPTEREDNTPLSIDEISHFSMYNVDCDAASADFSDEKYARIFHKQGIMYWASPDPVDCVIMLVTDTDGRQSLPSKIFKAVEYNAPRPAECRQ